MAANDGKIENSLVPAGISKAHFDNMVSMKNIIGLKKLGYESTINKCQSMQEGYVSLMRQMTHDAKHDRASKTNILATRAKADLKSLIPELDRLITSRKNIVKSAMNKITQPVDSPKSREIREILAKQDLNGLEVQRLAEKNPEILNAVLSSPLPQMAFGFTDLSINALNVRHEVNCIGSDYESMAAASQAAEALEDMQTTINVRLNAVIEADKNNQYTMPEAV